MDQAPVIKRNLFLVSESTNFTPSPHRKLLVGKPILSKPPEIKPRTNLNTSFMIESNNSSHSESPDSNIILRGIFTFENVSVDLELCDDNFLRWKSVRKKYYSNMISLDKCYSVESHLNKANLKKSVKSDTEVHIDGFVIHMFEKIKPNCYKNRSFIFEHPHHNTSKEWIIKIMECMPMMQRRKKVLILLNPYAGEKRTRSIFNFQVSTYLTAAQIEWDLIEFHDNAPLRDAIEKSEVSFDNYYGIIILAGDGGVSKFINVLVELTSRTEKFSKLNELSECLKTPLCFIPVGCTNMIANTLYGSIDICTPLMHLIHGNTTRIDLSSIFTNTDKLHSFGFTYTCGLGTTMARYFKRYSKLGPNKVQTALTRAIAKQKHRPIEVEIKYIKDKNYQPCDENLCTQNCKICSNEVKNLNARRTVDRVEEFDSIANSIEEIKQNLSTTINYKKSSYDEWEIIRGSFIHIAFLTNSNQWNLSPGGGLSKYAHLADGSIDLILVDQVTRKELYRYVKRHANYKNQLTLPFVKSIRIKEAKVRILNAGTSTPTNISNDNYFLSTNKKDNFYVDSESESDAEENNENEVKPNLNSTLSRIGSVKNSSKAGQKVYFIKNKTDLNISQSVDLSQRPTLKKSNSIVDFFKKKKPNESLDLNYIEDKASYPGRTSQIKYDKATIKSPSMWNCDWTLNNLTELHIKCNHKFLPVFGTGMDPETEFEISGTCLPGF